MLLYDRVSASCVRVEDQCWAPFADLVHTVTGQQCADFTRSVLLWSYLAQIIRWSSASGQLVPRVARTEDPAMLAAQILHTVLLTIILQSRLTITWQPRLDPMGFIVHFRSSK